MSCGPFFVSSVNFLNLGLDLTELGSLVLTLGHKSLGLLLSLHDLLADLLAEHLDLIYDLISLLLFLINALLLLYENFFLECLVPLF